MRKIAIIGTGQFADFYHLLLSQFERSCWRDISSATSSADRFSTFCRRSFGKRDSFSFKVIATIFLALL
jgi:predicted dehydrogenase